MLTNAFNWCCNTTLYMCTVLVSSENYVGFSDKPWYHWHFVGNLSFKCKFNFYKMTVIVTVTYHYIEILKKKCNRWVKLCTDGKETKPWYFFFVGGGGGAQQFPCCNANKNHSKLHNSCKTSSLHAAMHNMVNCVSFMKSCVKRAQWKYPPPEIIKLDRISSVYAWASRG